MPRLKNVTNADLAKLADAAFDVSQDAADYTQRLGQGYGDTLEGPLQRASGFLSVSRAFADLAHIILTKAQLEEQVRQTEKMVRDRLAKTPGE